MSSLVRHANSCRGCDSYRLATIADLGNQPLAGYYALRAESQEKASRYPLELMQCCDCGLLQITALPPISEVFHDQYRYSSSSIPDLRQHFHEYSQWLELMGAKGCSILEFGCNDGVLLDALNLRGISAQGVDASDNVASVARSKGHDVVTGFFDSEMILRNRWSRKFSLVTCSNVLAHIHDLRGAINSVAEVLLDGGRFAVEVHDADLMIDQGQFDTIYHEHLTYFTLATLTSVLVSSGFEIIRAERTTMHGGGLRVLSTLRHRNVPDGTGMRPKIVPAAGRLTESLAQSRAVVRSLFREYGALEGYGAAGRAQMFINLTGTHDCFKRVFDDSPLRQNRFIAGTDIPIEPYRNQSGDCLIILAWNYAASILRRIGVNYSAVFTVLPTLQRQFPTVGVKEK
jgi:SAM-dependent methyltransferase